MPSRLFLGLSASFAALALLAHCGSNSSSDDSGGPCTTPSCLPFDGSPPDEYVHDSSPPDGSEDGDASRLHPLCGANPACNPDDATACSNGPGAPLADASVSDAGADTAAPDTDDAALDASADGGPRRQACTLPAKGAEPRAECRPAGDAREDEVCESSADCAPGLACVGSELAAQCKPYCCRGSDVCSDGSYCAERPLLESLKLGKEVRVPVCITADGCNLADPYPCSGASCTCQDPETACTVVRADGTTSCVEPGSGKAGDACPCAWGHICSQATGSCLKLCSTLAEDTCSAGKCQASANLPRGYGVCVGR
jgi:hypothetical protein